MDVPVDLEASIVRRELKWGQSEFPVEPFHCSEFQTGNFTLTPFQRTPIWSASSSQLRPLFSRKNTYTSSDAAITVVA